MPTSWSAKVTAMCFAERIGRCAMRASVQTISGMSWNDSGTTTADALLEFMRWLLTPFGEQPGMPNVPRRVVCSNDAVVKVVDMLDTLGSTLSVSRNSGESDFDYSERLLLA